MSERIPLPMPFGWFRVSESKDLEAREIKTVHYLGEDFLLYRTEEGEACVTDPYCPHLGAHLGYGGTIEGGNIRCPFHHWSFDSTGQCVDIPYAKRIPAKAQLKSYPTIERNGIIFMWHHPDGIEPKWDLPVVEDWNTDGWLEPIYHTAVVRSHPQEMAENVVDSPHFKFVHGTPDIPEKTFTFEEHIMRAYQGLTFTTPDGERRIDTRALFIMIGAAPNTDWLSGLVGTDDNGFVITGSEAGRETPFETGTDGIFAVGDVRSGSVKRVASAVGEGSVVVSRIWSYLDGLD